MKLQFMCVLCHAYTRCKREMAAHNKRYNTSMHSFLCKRCNITFLDVYKLRKHQNYHSLKKQLKTYTRFNNDIRENPILKFDNKFHKEDNKIVKQEEEWIEDMSKVHEKNILNFNFFY